MYSEDDDSSLNRVTGDNWPVVGVMVVRLYCLCGHLDCAVSFDVTREHGNVQSYDG